MEILNQRINQNTIFCEQFLNALKYLAQQVLIGFNIDPAKRSEPILEILIGKFFGQILIKEKKKAIQIDIRSDLANLIF